MKFISLFAGIGGIDLGLHRAGMECVAQVEIDPYCRKVLAKHWPEVPRYEDVRTVGRHNLPECDLIAGGFPCQDISIAGRRAGIDGERSGLWREYYRIICELRPRYVLVENVSALLNRGMERVLGDLAACGYDAEWQVLRASDFGFPHRRERVFIVAYANSLRLQGRVCNGTRQRIKASPETTFWGNVPEPVISGGNNGVPDRMGRSKGCGNAVVPQVAEYIGRMIMQQHATLFEVSA